MIKRSALPRRKAYIARSKKRVRPVNPRAAKRRADAYRQYLKSATWRELKALVRARSGGQCERTRSGEIWRDYFQRGGRETLKVRCLNPARHTNHKRYPRVLGTETIDMLEDLCDGCNAEYENARPWRLARRRLLAHSTT